LYWFELGRTFLHFCALSSACCIGLNWEELFHTAHSDIQQGQPNALPPHDFLRP